MPAIKNTILSKPFVWLMAMFTLPLGLFPLLQFLALAQNGSDIYFTLELVLGCLFLAALFTLVIAPFLLIRYESRQVATRVLILTAVFVVASFTGLRLGARVRTAAFRDLAQRSAPLVQAIRSYDAKYGAPPQDLAALVPEFLSGIPRTGMAAYPEYDYRIGKFAAAHNGNPWIVSVFTPRGLLNFDQFVYYPLQNYPISNCVGTFEQIADWAYVHE